MMIHTYNELKFYILADRIMNGIPTNISVTTWFSLLFSKSFIGFKIRFLHALRCYSYYKRTHGIINRIKRLYYGRQFRKLSLKLGYSLGEDVFGYGLVLPHYGTIVVGGTNSVGNYAVMHTSTCIADCNCIIGNNFDFATGSIISKHVTIGNNVATCANSCITKNVPSNSLVAGSPAKVVRTDYPSWYDRDGELFKKRVCEVERLRSISNLNF